MYKLDKKGNDLEKYIIRLVVGLFLLIIAISIRNYEITNETVSTSQNLGGLYYSFDFTYYGLMIILLSVSAVLIIPSVIYLIRKVLMK